MKIRPVLRREIAPPSAGRPALWFAAARLENRTVAATPRVLVFGYSEVGHACLKLLLERGVRVVAVVTHADDPHETQWFPSVARLAASHDIPLLISEQLRVPELQHLVATEVQPDLIFSFYYRRLIPMTVLDHARLGAFNMHGSLLPKYRGRAPVNWAILKGESETGATLHHMVAQADAGDIVDQERVPIGAEDSVATIMRRVRDAAVTVLERQLGNLLQGAAPRRPQDHTRATYFGRRGPEDGRIDWTRPAREIFNLVRAVTHPFPGAFADFPPERRLMVWWARPLPGKAAPGSILGQAPLRIGTGDGCLELLECEWRPLADALGR
jgi:methionyl-tRNA formyltransferase